MNYVLLAAGRGTRMGGLSSYLQKCMYPIHGRPFLALLMESILGNRRFDPVRDRLILVVGHLGDQVRSYFGDAWRGIPLRYVTQDHARGTAHAVSLARESCAPGEPLIIAQGDVWAEAACFEALVDHPSADVLSIHRHECALRHDERLDVEGGVVTRAWKGSGPYVECGIWKFSPPLLDWMLTRKEDEYRALPAVQAAIEAGLRVGSLERETWIHLGGTEPSPEENLRAVLAHFSAGREG